MPKMRRRFSKENDEMPKLPGVICSQDGKHDSVSQSGNIEFRVGAGALNRHSGTSGNHLGPIYQGGETIYGIIINRHATNQGGHATVGGSQENVGVQPTKNRGPLYINHKRQGSGKVLQRIAAGMRPSRS